MRLALLLALAFACSSKPDKAGSPAQTQTPGGADCQADADCATTTYAPEPVKDGSGCCAALSCPRVETARRARELGGAWSAACAAVRCRAPSCPAGAPEPVAACQAGRCVAR